MIRGAEVLNKFLAFRDNYVLLLGVDEGLLNVPMQEGKWSIVDTVNHLVGWDQYLLHSVLPDIRTGNQVSFPDHDTFNRQSTEPIPGVSAHDVLSAAIQLREELVKQVNNLTDDLRSKPVTVNENSHCPHTQEAYTLLYLIGEFVEHDWHHQKQIDAYLSRSAHVAKGNGA